MSALMQRLSRGDARPRIACLPVNLRALPADAVLGETFEQRREEPEASDREELLARVAGGLAVEQPEPIARAVFRATQEYLHEGRVRAPDGAAPAQFPGSLGPALTLAGAQRPATAVSPFQLPYAASRSRTNASATNA